MAVRHREAWQMIALCVEVYITHRRDFGRVVERLKAHFFGEPRILLGDDRFHLLMRSQVIAGVAHP